MLVSVPQGWGTRCQKKQVEEKNIYIQLRSAKQRKMDT